ncbi:MAG TPA: hypothetical protein VFN18_08740 [Solirubrobacterales bacterium]|nr:hypothetical protein [Solirubrobacterales bacterium]
MAADAGLWLAIGFALYIVAISVVGVVLCRLAPRLGIEAEVEIKGPSFRLKFRAPYPGAATGAQESSNRLPREFSRQQQTPSPDTRKN